MPVYESPGAGRVLIATSGGPLVAEPTWTRFDNITLCRCEKYDWQRGRQSEFDVTNTGTARVYFHDRNGTFDDESLIGKQIMLQLYDPVAAAWEPCFRGHIDDISSEPNPNASTVTTVLECVDIFDYLSGVRMVVGEFGDVTPAGMTGVVFYEDGNFQTRVEALLDDAGLDTDMYQVFTGNINVTETQYTDDDILSAVRDATDAEFPSGVAQAYVDRFGRVAVHGRLARFDPDATSATAGDAAWDFRRWDAATRGDVGTTRAQIRSFEWNRPRTRIINSYLAYPRGIKEEDILTLQVTDATSISAYGYRGREAPDLIVKSHQTNGNTGAEECALYGEYFLAAYAEPRKNVERVTFKSLNATDNRATATWALMVGADISDMLHLFVAEAGLSDTEFYIEGVQGECKVGGPALDFVTITYNLSPFSYFDTNPF